MAKPKDAKLRRQVMAMIRVYEGQGYSKKESITLAKKLLLSPEKVPAYLSGGKHATHVRLSTGKHPGQTPNSDDGSNARVANAEKAGPA